MAAVVMITGLLMLGCVLAVSLVRNSRHKLFLFCFSSFLLGIVFLIDHRPGASAVQLIFSCILTFFIWKFISDNALEEQITRAAERESRNCKTVIFPAVMVIIAFCSMGAVLLLKLPVYTLPTPPTPSSFKSIFNSLLVNHSFTFSIVSLVVLIALFGIGKIPMNDSRDGDPRK
jgi:NADH:ubiquinone oxidoreductase subunit 6 (subunit J)